MEHEIKNKLLEWVVRKNGNIQAKDIDCNTNIIETRIINSIHVMDLILYMESLLGRPVNVERIKAGAFATINSIYETFFREETQDA